MDRPLADLSPQEKRDMLAQQLKQKAAAPRRFPLSFAQQRLWLVDQLEGSSAFYNVSFATYLRGPLQVDALESAIQEIVRRHDTLRTSFVMVDEQPMQVVSPTVEVRLHLKDLRYLPAQERGKAGNTLLEEGARRPFDLAEAPLIRTLLVRLEAEEHLFLVTMHHIISDGWSSGIFHGELETLYSAFVDGKPSLLPTLPIQYADYAVWQREWLQGQVLQTQLDYWKGQLAGAPQLLALPADRPRPAAQTYRGAQQSITLPPDLLQALESLSKREGVTLFMTLLAAFKALLYRYTGQPDIVTGVPIANRTRTEVEGLIGFFANTLVLRTNLSGTLNFHDLLGRVRAVSLGAYAHQDLPFEKLVEELQPERNLSYNPLFQVMFGFENTPRSLRERSGLVFEPALFDGGTSIVDLSITIMDTPQGMQAQAEYSTDLFDASTIARLLGHYLTLLEAVTENPGVAISHLPMLSQDERHTLLAGGNSTHRDYPRDKWMHQLFAEQARRTPGKTALVFGEEQLTYRQLDERANRLAHYLRGLGVGPETLVGICVERSVDMLVSVLGVLKAGGAYVPLDATYPKERLAHMVRNSQAKVLITQEGLAELAQKLAGHVTETLVLDLCRNEIEQQPSDDPGIEISPDNLAYVIYTSGSTGMPKGVMLPHRALTNHLWSMRAEPGLAAEDVLLAVTSLSFDIAALELYLPLIAGATLVLASRERATDGTLLGREIAKRGVTAMQGTPATWRLLLIAESLPAQAFAKLKALCGGEAMPAALAEELCAQTGQLWNMYGPTETCIWSTTQKVELTGKPGTSATHPTVSIGRPIANTQVYLLDRYGEPVPLGVAGELHIGGEGLARGYFNRPDLTAERFVPDPFGAQPGARLYRTGDLARYLPDGNIEFLGRIDHQVKVRGFRIELGEIESALGQHPGVRQAIVIVSSGDGASDNDKQLVAYIVPQPGQAPPSAEMRAHLQARLPEYMVPSTFVLMEQMPLTPNGKVDRKALPDPGSTDPRRRGDYVAPRTPLETQLTEVWAAVLHKEQIGVTDSFFALGGHSLSAMQMVSRVRTALGIELPLRSLFETPTIEGLAAAMSLKKGSHAMSAPPIVSLASRSEEVEDEPLNLEELSGEEIESLLATLPE
ncbi:MAG: amino acid adenylation domain-containing protein [Chloroflexia bacterium]